MTTDIDWQHELDSSFGAGHDVPAGHYVAVGRRAVRRRRAAAVVAAATIAICGGAAWASSPGAAPRSDAPVATHGQDPKPQDPTEEQDRRAERRQQLADMRSSALSVEEEFLGNPAVFDDGRLKLSPRTDVVLERVPNPMAYTPGQGRSVGLRVMYEGRERYSLIADFGAGDWSINTNDATGDFAGWLDSNVRTQRSLDVLNGVTASTPSTNESDPDTWLTLTTDGMVQAAEGNVLLEVRVDVDLGEGFALDADRTGAARMLVAGRLEHLAYRIVDGRLEVIAGPGSHASLSEFIAWARQQYASGEGMR